MLLEVPVGTMTRGERNSACGGGGWFRVYPYGLSWRRMQSINRVERQSAVSYCHPWEFDPAQSKQLGHDFRTRFRHYANLCTMESKVDRLLCDMILGRMDDIFLGKAVPLAANM